MADKKTAKKTTKNKTDAAATMYNITKSNGNVIFLLLYSTFIFPPLLALVPSCRPGPVYGLANFMIGKPSNEIKNSSYNIPDPLSMLLVA